MRRRCTIWWSLLLCALANAQKFQPPTEFKSGYRLPVPNAPLPRAEWLATADVAVLAGCLALAAYLVLRRRSRRGVYLLTVASLLYFGFYRHGCICPVGSIQNVALAVADQRLSCCDCKWQIHRSLLLRILRHLWTQGISSLYTKDYSLQCWHLFLQCRLRHKSSCFPSDQDHKLLRH